MLTVNVCVQVQLRMQKKNMVSYYKNCAPLENKILLCLLGFFFFAASYQSHISVFTEALQPSSFLGFTKYLSKPFTAPASYF